ncbi:thiosulfate oxidation carrier protein SoxY [Hyphomicrobium sp.]|uniref:thiosulfate oxidation carrier protein SoxY n=1 Tax=Hyphomicrobium sp. TaxID=82 RepID=UPI0025C45DC1|nr:thiosulfate oxidation carrier protein SoxY [Hyphomicrobium sp.]MCC7252015.1 thiosulfate oxidation carrier protein SoxY [Hyphomicrobium sp.]
MTSRKPGRTLVDRRMMLASAGALTLSGLAPRAARAQSGPSAAAAAAAADPAPLVPTAQFNAAFEKIVGGGTPIEGGVTLELPEDAENGNIVPYKINIESPMTEADHIARVHLLSTQNPQASVATFHFTPLSGKAAVSGRMRLAKTQEVVAVAVTSANTLLVARTIVNVGIGGCGTE